MLSEHYLQEDGGHTQQDHVKAMLDCIAACAAYVNFVSRDSAHYALYCNACAEICRAYVDSFEEIGGMDEWVEACRACAETCGSVAT